MRITWDRWMTIHSFLLSHTYYSSLQRNYNDHTKRIFVGNIILGSPKPWMATFKKKRCCTMSVLPQPALASNHWFYLTKFTPNLYYCWSKCRHEKLPHMGWFDILTNIDVKRHLVNMSMTFCAKSVGSKMFKCAQKLKSYIILQL